MRSWARPVSETRVYAYAAMDETGRRVRGELEASDELQAFEGLKRQGLTPIKIDRAKARRSKGGSRRLSESALADLLFELGTLLGAGADIRSALGIVAARASDARTDAAVKAIGRRVQGGDAVSMAFAAALGPRGRFAAALIAAGEARGDLGAGLRQGGQLIRTELQMRGKLVEVLSYPAFILFSSVAALLIILIYVIPSIEPMMTGLGAEPPLVMEVLVSLSRAVRRFGPVLAGALAGLLLGGLVAARLGVLGDWWDRFVMDGPIRSMMSSFVYGRFSQVLGQLQAAGVPLAEAMRIASGSVGSPLAEARLSDAARSVRQGAGVAAALSRAPRFPDRIVRLAMIGEQTGELGSMLERAGAMELEDLVRRIERLARVLGPTLIILLGAVIGLMMGGLLTGVSSMGEGL